MTSSNNKKWWEKTVEYAFILMLHRVAPENARSFFAPLDGDEERAGDLVGAFGKKWFLVEFKKDEDSLGSEAKKYTDYATAAATLRGSDSHHLLVYGYMTEDNNFALSALTYFSRAVPFQKWKEFFNHGTDKAAFDNYLVKLTAFKNKNPPDSGGGFGMKQLQSVIGLDNDNNVVEVHTLEDYEHHLVLTRQLTQQHTMTRSIGRSRDKGMDFEM
ncbi:hypothetical protein HNQ50_000317 [Silvimonas terrae]|uniref:Restriction endonuclease n=1 Tax=Silvimonas terrae TaxID=300266 RepID=A0A840R9M3_9NEIS|nr:hypothetical protein [Silvimonas terrae]MBB5189607.1 hypothetical protein [Silvimonas terrae]